MPINKNKKPSNRGGYKPAGAAPGVKPTLFKVNCTECGTPCQVPFKPTGDRPVLCRECFTGSDSAPKKSKFERPSYERPTFDRSARPAPGDRRPGGPDPVKAELDKINAKLDRILTILDDMDEEE